VKKVIGIAGDVCLLLWYMARALWDAAILGRVHPTPDDE
jgi:hypothetical protein